MANSENLRPPTHEEALERGKKGGIASGVAKRKNKLLREELEVLLNTKNKDGKTNQYRMSVSLLEQALNGNVQAFCTIRDTIGQKPVDKVENSVSINYEEELKKIADEEEY